MKKTLVALSLVFSFSALACIPQSKVLNDDTNLSFDGVYGDGYSVKIKDLIKKEQVTKTFTASDKNDVPTHEVRVLGYIKGKKGKGSIISTAYYTKDLNTGAEKIYEMKSNESEDGSMSRSIGQVSIVDSIGCGK